MTKLYPTNIIPDQQFPPPSLTPTKSFPRPGSSGWNLLVKLCGMITISQLRLAQSSPKSLMSCPLNVSFITSDICSFWYAAIFSLIWSVPIWKDYLLKMFGSLELICPKIFGVRDVETTWKFNIWQTCFGFSSVD